MIFFLYCLLKKIIEKFIMKFLNTNYDYFVEIEIWRMKNDNDSYLYRYCYAKESPFWKNMDISMEEKSKLEQNWKLYQTFFAFSNAYASTLGRGYYSIQLVNRKTYPYEILHLFEFPLRYTIQYKGETFLTDINFVVALYPFPYTKIFYIGTLSEFNVNRVCETFVWTKELEATGEKSKYTFLPSKQNINIPWYKIYSPPFKNSFYYVYTTKPNTIYWRLNSEDIILPSTNPKDAKTLEEISKNLGKNTLKNPKVIVQTNSKPLYDIKYKDYPQYIWYNKEYNWKIFVLFLFILISLFILQILI